MVIDTRYISLKFEDKFGFRLEKYFCLSLDSFSLGIIWESLGFLKIEVVSVILDYLFFLL